MLFVVTSPTLCFIVSPPLGDPPSAAKQDVADGQHGVLLAQVVSLHRRAHAPHVLDKTREGTPDPVAAALPLGCGR